MEIESVGPWLLLGVGVFLLLAGAVATVRPNPPRWPWIWVFGLACAGIGAYGPAFMEPYGKWVKLLLEMDESSPQTYADVFERIGRGDLPPKLQDMALSYALNRPIERMDQELKRAIKNAGDDRGRGALHETQLAFEQRAEVATEICNILAQRERRPAERTAVTAETLMKFDPVTRLHLTRELPKLSKERLDELEITPGTLKRLERVPVAVPLPKR